MAEQRYGVQETARVQGLLRAGVFTPRRLTVQEFIQARPTRQARDYRALTIRLIGQWIREAGLQQGDRVTVDNPAPGVLVVRREDAPWF